MSDKCLECGALCCKYQMSLVIPLDQKDDIEYWEARADKRIPTPNGNLYLFKSRCRSLVDDRCIHFGTEKLPQYCKEYPFGDTHPNWKYLCKLLQDKE